jgi:hypothetical protein
VTYVAAHGGTTCIASDAAALGFNTTVIGPSAAGDLRLFPSNMSPAPVVSTINFPAGVQLTQTAFAQMRLGLRTQDDLGIIYDAPPSTTGVVLDAFGYFGGSAATLNYVPVRPCRAIDTRDPNGGYVRMATSVRQDFQIQGNCGVPRGAKAVFANVTVIAPDGAGFMGVWPAGVARPVPPAITYNAGEPGIGNALIIPLSTFGRDLSAQGFPGLHLTIDVSGYFIAR